MTDSTNEVARRLVSAEIGQDIDCLAAFVSRGPDHSRWGGPNRGGLGMLFYGLRYLVGRARRRVPSRTYLAAARDARLYAIELRWAPAKVHRVIDSWPLSEVCIVARLVSRKVVPPRNA